MILRAERKPKYLRDVTSLSNKHFIANCKGYCFQKVTTVRNKNMFMYEDTALYHLWISLLTSSKLNPLTYKTWC